MSSKNTIKLFCSGKPHIQHLMASLGRTAQVGSPVFSFSFSSLAVI
jgi:hypothetical protein